MRELNDDGKVIIAHRGYRAKYPENTLAAFLAAKHAGAHMIELDVTLSRDSQLVVIHDETLDRTTNGSGWVKKHTFDELILLDAGAWFDPAFKGEKIPLLDQVLDAVKGSLNVNIEIKSGSNEFQQAGDVIETKVLELVKNKKMESEVIISSFDWGILENIRNMDDMIAIALLSEHQNDVLLTAWCRWLNAFSWNPDYRVLSKDQVDDMHEIGVKVFPYTVNTKKEIDVLVDMGVDGVITDDPILFRH